MVMATPPMVHIVSSLSCIAVAAIPDHIDEEGTKRCRAFLYSNEASVGRLAFGADSDRLTGDVLVYCCFPDEL